jgi:hypothetical protein
MTHVVFAAVAATALLAVASSAHAHGERALPLGDGKLVTQTPQRGHVLVCSTRFPGGGGAHRVGEWIEAGQWWPSRKPQVEGAVAWPSARIGVTREGSERVVRANNLPLHATGEFPVRPGSDAHAYDRNPNRIAEQPILLRLPAEPTVQAVPSCVPMGMIGFSLSGTAIFNAFDLAGRDAPAYEVQDRCNGHPERGGQYHVHDWSSCFADSDGDAGRHSSIAGWMLDGFPIFGPRGDGGRELTNADLDECHGHTHAVQVDARRVVTYHYHFTREYPYTIGCFRGTPTSTPRSP